MKKIILTGGGTAGHVTPNLALVPLLKKAGYDILYVGSKEGIEKKIVEEEGLAYEGISAGKLRRYMSAKNVSDVFRTMHGLREARHIIRDYQPDIVFSKGGFVSVPVVAAANEYKVPVITHESDLTIGLANKINLRSAKLLCCNFPETAKGMPEGSVVVTGCPIRQELFEGNVDEGRKLCGFEVDEAAKTGAADIAATKAEAALQKPVLMVTGGSLGSVAVNNAIRAALPELLKNFRVVHLCGKGNLDESLVAKTNEQKTSGGKRPDSCKTPGGGFKSEDGNYVQFEYVSRGVKDLFALADIVVSRAGANAICELVALKKPNLLIPLPSSSSRGDQILNAESFKKQGLSDMLLQEDITTEILVSKINDLYARREEYKKKMAESDTSDSAKKIFDLIEKYKR